MQPIRLHITVLWLCAASLWLLPVAGQAQGPGTLSNLRTRHVPLRAWQRLDTLTLALPLLSASDSATGQPLEARFFSLHNSFLRTDTAALRAACPGCQTLRIRYRVLPLDLSAPFRRLDTISIRRRRLGEPDIAFDYTPYSPAVAPWETSGLRSSGAYTRGLSFGNNQNLVFNSNLNLQIDGRLGNDLELVAALSDNSVPLQPDGTTRQLQEFDRIFIQIKRRRTRLIAGDFDLVAPSGGYFAQYFKRVQGAMVESELRSPNKGDKASTPPPPPAVGANANLPPAGLGLSARAGAAISRGKFSRQVIQGQEGNQGPYRLQGAEGERFIIVLAGTEKVYVDGQLMRRGLQDDYVVDYNLGELTFTARRLVTKDIRIIVEFEYAVQNYLRSTTVFDAAWRRRSARTWLQAYSEQDGRSNSSSGDLSPQERRRLALAGDNLREAYASGIDTLPDFDAARVLYRYADTVACGQPLRVLVYSADVANARYAARFTEVPQGQGNYVQALSAANGRVFRWVPPDPVTCQPQGNFEPVVRLIAPELRQLYTLGAEVSAFGGSRIKAEAALSNCDLNRFSPLGNADNLGAALFASIQAPLISPTARRSGKEIGFYASYERASRQFRPLNPYRPAEFVRDWNVDNSRDTVAEQVLKGGLQGKWADRAQAGYEMSAFQRMGVYTGQRHLGQARLHWRGYELMAEANDLQTRGLAERTRFSRPKAEVAKTFFGSTSPAQPPHSGTQAPNARPPSLLDSLPPAAASQRPATLKIGLYAERERNEREAVGTDTLSRSSFWYDLYRAYFQTLDARRTWQLGGSLSQRNDFAPVRASFRQNTAARNVEINGSWQSAQDAAKKSSVQQQINWNFSYRTLRVVAPELSTQTAQRSYLGRADHTLSAWKNTLNLTTGYELGSGQSPRVEFNYLMVNPGEGQYTWADRNRDSIVQVDEMEVAVFQDQANYVRVAVTTSDYLRTNNVVLNQNLRLDPRMLWGRSRHRWKRTLSRVSTQSTFLVNRRSFASARGISPWNPYQLNVPDTALAALSRSVRNVLFLNRAQPAWDASFAQGDNQNHVLLTTGFERRRHLDRTLHGRINLSRHWSAEADVVLGEKSSQNEAFSTRNFQILYWEAGPKITWLPDPTFRTEAEVKAKTSQNHLGSRERATQTEWVGELTWNPRGRQNAQGFRPATSLRLRATLADIRYLGAPNTAVAFSMLEGLQDGRNFLWTLSLDRQLSKSVQLNLQYEGRKTGDRRTVHVGRAQVRAVF